MDERALREALRRDLNGWRAATELLEDAPWWTAGARRNMAAARQSWAQALERRLDGLSPLMDTTELLQVRGEYARAWVTSLMARAIGEGVAHAELIELVAYCRRLHVADDLQALGI